MKGAADVLYEQLLVGHIGRRGFKAKVLVESPRLLVYSVNEHEANPRLLGDRERPIHRIFKEEGAETFALNRPVDCQSSKQYCRYLVPGHALPCPLSRLAVLDGSNRQGVIAHNPALLIIDHDVGPGGASPSRRVGMLDEPDVERADSAIEPIDPVPAVERLGI